MIEEKREDLEKRLAEFKGEEKGLKCKEQLAVIGQWVAVAGAMPVALSMGSYLLEKGYPFPVALGGGLVCGLAPAFAGAAACRHYEAKICQLGEQIRGLYRECWGGRGKIR